MFLRTEQGLSKRSFVVGADGLDTSETDIGVVIGSENHVNAAGSGDKPDGYVIDERTYTEGDTVLVVLNDTFEARVGVVTESGSAGSEFRLNSDGRLEVLDNDSGFSGYVVAKANQDWTTTDGINNVELTFNAVKKQA